MLDNVTIIIPVSLDESEHETLLQKFKETEAEIIVSCEGSRSKSMNVGAAKSTRQFLWFLHADSLVDFQNFKALTLHLNRAPKALHYFDLFYAQGGLARLNAVFANIRSRLFALPYGDQGLCISRMQFNMVGGYPEDTPYGEDVLFVRLAKKNGVRLNPVCASITTSARKYRKQGWVKVTLYNQYALFHLLRRRL